jgi:hypothetical protein
MRGIARLVVVAAAAVALFVWALATLGEPPERECLMGSSSDPSYRVQVEEAPSVSLTTYHLLVTRGDRPVQGARVCVRLDMGGRSGSLSAVGAADVADEVSPGRYAVDLRLRSGPWQGVAVVTEPGERAVAAPVTFEVA